LGRKFAAVVHDLLVRNVQLPRENGWALERSQSFQCPGALRLRPKREPHERFKTRSIQVLERTIREHVEEMVQRLRLRDKSSAEVQQIVSKRFFGRRPSGDITSQLDYCRPPLEVLVERRIERALNHPLFLW
jgi:hypothetical protein